MSAPNKIDRGKVLRFFTWKNRELHLLLSAIACLVVASWISFVGVAIAMRNAEKAWVLIYTFSVAAVIASFAAFIIRNALRADRSILKFHSEVNRVKNFDFASVLVRAFRKTEADPDSLLDFDQAGLVTLDPESVTSGDKDLIRTLAPKSIFLFGRQGHDGLIKFLFVERNMVVEYSPIRVAILFLTRSELIVCYASLDIIKGDISQEEVNHIPLMDVAGVMTEPVNRRMHRSGNEMLFQEYERIVRNNPSNDLMSVEHLIRVARNDGEDLFLPAGDPGYGGSIRRIRDSREAIEDHFAHIAEEVSRKIREAKEALKSEVRKANPRA